MRVRGDDARAPTLGAAAARSPALEGSPRGLADQSLARIIGRIAPVTVVVQFAGFLFSVVLARVLGSSTGTDAYFLALSVPAAIYMVMLAALRQGATPAMTDSLARSDQEFARASSQLVSSVALFSAALAIVVTGIALVALPLAVAEGSHRLVSLVRADLVALAPLPILGGVTGALGAIQTVRGRVTPAVAVLAFEPISKAAFVLTLGTSLGATALIVGHLVGSTLATATLWAMIRRSGVDLRLAPTILPPFVRDVVRLSTPLIVSQSVLQANPIVDRTMAATLGSGSVTQLELGVRLFFGATALISGTLIGPLTGTWAARRLHYGWEAVRTGVVRGVVTVLAILPPLVTLGVVLRHPMVQLLYGGGAYSDRALHVTADVLGMLVLGLPAQVLVIVFASLFVVQRSTVFPMLVGMTNVVLNVALNFALRPLWGAPGIALSTSLTMTVLLVPYIRSATVRWDLRLREVRSSAARAAVATATLVVAALALMKIPWGQSNSAMLAEITVLTTVLLLLHAVVLVVAREPLALGVARGARQMLVRHHER
jgi:putative peptidoglycan lipid II flippase